MFIIILQRENLVAVHFKTGYCCTWTRDIGGQAGKRVMEGKVCFSRFLADIDVFDIEVDEKDPAKLIEFCRQIAPTFGGII